MYVYTIWYIHTHNAVHIYHIYIHIHVYLHITQWHFNNLLLWFLRPAIGFSTGLNYILKIMCNNWNTEWKDVEMGPKETGPGDFNTALSSRSAENCPTIPWPRPFRHRSLLNSSPCCRDRPGHLTEGAVQIIIMQYIDNPREGRLLLPARSPFKVSQTLQLKSS